MSVSTAEGVYSV